MIIVEGPDGAGKSTLVERLCKLYGLEVGTRGTSNRDLLWTVTVPDTMRALGWAVGGFNNPKIWDRLYYSDFVYAPIQGRKVAFNDSQQGHVDAVIESLRCPIIVCLPPRDVVLVNVAKVHQMDTVDENIGEIYDTYHAMTYRTGDAIKPFPEHRIVYDYTFTGIRYETDVLEEIEDYLDNRQERMP